MKHAVNQIFTPPPIMSRTGLAAMTIAAFAFFTSCSKFDEGLALESPPEPTAEADPFTIPVEEALDNMYDLMEEIYGPATRASTRPVATVETLKGSDFGGMQTRSGAALPTSMAYVVNFAGNQGFAVLGAHVAAEPVYCITDAGSFTSQEMADIVEDLTAPPVIPTPPVTPVGPPITPVPTPDGGGDDDGDDPDDGEDDPDDYWIPADGDWFIKEIVIEAVTRADWDTISDSGLGSGTGSGSTTTPSPAPGGVVTEQCVTVNTEKYGPYIRTKWGQGFPYNMWCPDWAPAGCVAVALAQIIAYYEWPAPWDVYGTIDVSWKDMKDRDYNSIYSSYFAAGNHRNTNIVKNPLNSPGWHIDNCMAAVIQVIGSEVGMKYGVNGSRASNKNAMKYMKRLGYNKTTLIKEYGLEHIEFFLGYGWNRPIYICAYQQNSVGHAWVMDGYVRRDEFYDTYVDGVFTNRRLNKQYSLYHCNFGWKGASDGYYWSGAFNTLGGRDDDAGRFELELGLDSDLYGKQGGHYNKNYEILQIYAE